MRGHSTSCPNELECVQMQKFIDLIRYYPHDGLDSEDEKIFGHDQRSFWP